MGKHDKNVAILSYFIVGILWYFVDKDVQSDLAKFHVKQAIVLFLGCILLSLIKELLLSVTLLGPFMLVALHIGLVVLWIIGLVRAINGEMKELPVINSWTKYLKF